MKRVAALLTVVARYTTVVLLAGPASLAYASEVSAQPVQAQTQSAAKSAYANRLICKRETVVGSYIRTQRCRTQAMIDQERAAFIHWTEEARRSSIKSFDELSAW